MKKFLVAILAILYLGTSTGTTIQVHYCMGKLAGWELLSGKSDRCSKCGMVKSVNQQKHKCCNDVFKTFKSSDHKITEAAGQLSLVSFTEFIRYDEFTSTGIFPTRIANYSLYSNLRTPVALRILNCVFRI